MTSHTKDTHDTLPSYVSVVFMCCRLCAGAWCPNTISWGGNNRTVLCRVPSNDRLVGKDGREGEREGWKQYLQYK